MAKKKFNGIRILVTLVVLVIAGYFVYNDVVKTLTPPDPTTTKLNAPANVTFDERFSTLSWDPVENANGYVVSYNDTTYEVSQTSHYILPTAEQNVFKVKALGDDIDYTDSDWSKECVYTITGTPDTSVFEKVNLQLAKTAEAEGLTLIRVIGISVADPEATYGFSFETICNDGRKNVNATISYDFDGSMTLEEMLQSIESVSSSVIVRHNIVEYNSAEELLTSQSFDGQMEELRLQGYTFTVVDSCVREGKETGSTMNPSLTFNIVATYKAEKDCEVRYFTSVNQIKIYHRSRIESNNYETSVGYIEDRQVTETYFVEHTNGPMWEYMSELVGASDTQN